MNFYDLILLSFINLKGHALRSMLTVFGVAIGIGSIFFLVSLGFGLQRLTIERIGKSTSLLTLDVTTGKSSILKLDEAMARRITILPGVSEVSSVIAASGQFGFADSVTDGVVTGVDRQFLDLGNVTMLAGHLPLVENDVAISSVLVKTLGFSSTDDALDKEIRVIIFLGNGDGRTSGLARQEHRMKVVGVTDEQAAIGYIPIGTYHDAHITAATNLKVSAKSPTELTAIKTQLIDLGLQVTSIADLIDQINAIFGIIQGILAAFGVVALFVAAIGMFNTMTITLLERIRDIGVMNALGATTRTVVTMFLLEATIMGGAGGLVGLGFSYMLALGINTLISLLAVRMGRTQSIFFTLPPTL